VYFRDAEEQLNQRTTLIDHLDPEILQMLQRIIHSNNCFSQGLMTAYEQYGAEQIQNVAIVIKSTPALGRRYDAPSCPEISAMVMENSTDGGFSPHDIVISDRNRGHRYVNSLNPSYMPLHYVLMFPYGEDGWRLGIPSTNGQKDITARAYSAYMVMVRNNYYVQHYNRLFQQTTKRLCERRCTEG
ncbi:hypothetical protein, partial, partial [Absidia glauca]